jgi:hypothetical protein
MSACRMPDGTGSLVIGPGFVLLLLPGPRPRSDQRSETCREELRVRVASERVCQAQCAGKTGVHDTRAWLPLTSPAFAVKGRSQHNIDTSACELRASLRVSDPRLSDSRVRNTSPPPAVLCPLSCSILFFSPTGAMPCYLALTVALFPEGPTKPPLTTLLLSHSVSQP